jgi:plasmid maintenance system antidote protein VapI
MPPDQSQEFLFQRIKELLPQNETLVDAIAEVLHVSTDSAYRRIRNETPLVLEEAKQLCEYFHLSLDQILNIKSGSTLFQTVHINRNHYSFENYLSDIITQLKYFSKFSEKEIIYLTKDVTLFANCISQPLFAFRYFFWMKSIIQHPGFSTLGFSTKLLTPKIAALGDELLKLYNIVPSTEIWNTECVNSTIFQIEYCKEAGLFSSASDIAVIYDSLAETMDHLKQQVEFAVKFLPGENPSVKKNNLRFFYNRVVLGDNTILVIADNIKTLFLNYDVLNYMATADEVFCNETHNELENLMKRSTLISGTSEKQRNIFFSILLGKVEDRKKNL